MKKVFLAIVILIGVAVLFLLAVFVLQPFILQRQSEKEVPLYPGAHYVRGGMACWIESLCSNTWVTVYKISDPSSPVDSADSIQRRHGAEIIRSGWKSSSCPHSISSCYSNDKGKSIWLGTYCEGKIVDVDDTEQCPALPNYIDLRTGYRNSWWFLDFVTGNF